MPRMMTARTPGLLLLLTALAALVTARAAASYPLAPPTATSAWTARVLAPVTARDRPSARASGLRTLQPFAPLGGGPQVLLVLGAARGGDGHEWVNLLLPRRPNGSSGWVRADVLRFRPTELRLLVDQSDRRITLYRSGHEILRAPVAVGKRATPTPNGHFAVAEVIRTHTRGAFLGPVVLPLTGFSETLNEFAGGRGRVAIHGTSLPELLGTRASHGCVRVGNADIQAIARLVTPGTPVTIRT